MILHRILKYLAPTAHIAILIKSNEFSSILRTQQTLKKGCVIKISDIDYRIATKESFEKFLRWSDVSNMKYIANPEVFDCDNFAVILYGEVMRYFYSDLAFGILWGEGDTIIDGRRLLHAWNFFIDEDKALWWVEPQNDKLYRPDNERKIHFILG